MIKKVITALKYLLCWAFVAVFAVFLLIFSSSITKQLSREPVECAQDE